MTLKHVPMDASNGLDSVIRQANRERVLTGIPEDWRVAIARALADEPFGLLADRLVEEWSRPDTAIYPPEPQVFRALGLTPLAEVRAVILGQDPYHKEGLATGLAFSIPDGYKQPRSLHNILQARENDIGLPVPTSGSLEQWARNGVLLMNTALTVRRDEANSHREIWTPFTEAVIAAVDAQTRPIAFLLWGRQAQHLRRLVSSRAPVESFHPAARGAKPPFIASNPFSRADAILRDLTIWSLPGDP